MSFSKEHRDEILTSIASDSCEKMASATWLQGIGAHLGKRADEIQIGDVLMWNYGYTSEVLAVTESSPKFVTVTTLCEGKTYERRLKKDRIVAIKGSGVYVGVTKGMMR